MHICMLMYAHMVISACKNWWKQEPGCGPVSKHPKVKLLDLTLSYIHVWSHCWEKQEERFMKCLLFILNLFLSFFEIIV